MMDVTGILRREVEQRGVLSLARFMELALYCPESGYYERRTAHGPSSESAAAGQRIGREGDYYTSVSTSSLFGHLLGFQFAQWLEELAGQNVCDPGSQPLRPAFLSSSGLPRFQVVETGAHDGALAFDILSWLKQHHPYLLCRLQYWLIEPSGQRQSWQRAKLDSFADLVRWADSFQALSTGVRGIIFCNELLDSLPVHRLAWDRPSGKWMEWGVGLSNDQFVWRPLRSPECDWNTELAQAGFELSSVLLSILPDGFIIDHCPAARTWWRQAAAALHHGRLLTIDYGLTAHQLLSPERSQGTLRAYQRHQITGDVLANPGEQDLTTHVNFTQLQKTGEADGLKTDAFLTQAQFLTAIATRFWAEGGVPPSSSHVRQFLTLTHPEHLGRPFRVLIQSRNG